jgi:hypothetical protein
MKSPWKEWRDIYNRLLPSNRQLMTWLLCALWVRQSINHRATPFPVRFSFQVALITFAHLFILPIHPMSIPTDLGGGLSL